LLADAGEGKTVPGDCPPDDRLESWNEIATYLQRDLRTVIQWQKRAGLPVHGAGEQGSASVFACKSELDAWWNARGGELEKQEATAGSSGRYLKWALAGAALTVGATVGVWLFRPSTLNFEAQDWLLIAGLENSTGIAAFDDVLQCALERALGESRHIRIVPRERIRDTLRLMNLPLHASVDAALAREICLRDGGIHALLTGGIEMAGPAVILRVNLVDPARGISVAGAIREVPAEDQLLAAIARLSGWVRKKLGEPSSQVYRRRRNPEGAHGPSLRGLQLYARGIEAFEQARWPDAERLFAAAVEADPGFAGAHLCLCRAIHSQAPELRREECIQHARRALGLAGQAGERERYAALGAFNYVLGELEEARAAYVKLAELHPGDYRAADLASRLCRAEQASSGDRLKYALQAAGIRPNSVPDLLRAACRIATCGGPWGQVESLLLRAAKVLASAPSDEHSEMFFRIFPPSQAGHRTDPAGVLGELQRLEHEIDSMMPGCVV
jgi:tetratricopeptide (TPR) repeat protein